MTRLLAVETATAATSVAVLEGPRVVAEAADATRPHAAALLPALERVLGEAGVGLDAIDAFAVSIGPGSFTGLRIGIATLKAFALGTDRPVAPVPTLAALAWPLRKAEGMLVPCLDAQRGELYAAGYRAAGDGIAACLAESAFRPEELAARLEDSCLLVGEGIDAVGRALEEVGLTARLLPAAPRASAVGEVGARMLARGEGREAAAVVPRYVRRAEAEARRLGRPLEPGRPAGGTL
jgi:tRNA threonylcarbamoyladenosine biosynthesis protein TsaB